VLHFRNINQGAQKVTKLTTLSNGPLNKQPCVNKLNGSPRHIIINQRAQRGSEGHTIDNSLPRPTSQTTVCEQAEWEPAPHHHASAGCSTRVEDVQIAIPFTREAVHHKLDSLPGGMFGSAERANTPSWVHRRRLTGRLWNTTSCLTVAPLTHSHVQLGIPETGSRADSGIPPAASR
jgi:hypothetical protein